ncbi:MAG: hypothetical protein Q9225_004404, partial [Loekoesia sp. 1 TL-2023]
MSEQVQIFWDPYLKAFVIEVPNRNQPSSATPPLVVTPEDFQAPPTRAATFVVNPNAPLGSFYNPIPHPSESATAPVNTMPTNSPNPAFQASVHTPSWPQDPSAPLGSFHNPYPHGAFHPLAAVVQAPTPTPGSTPTHPATTPGSPQPLAPEPAWQPTAADFKEIFNS